MGKGGAALREWRLLLLKPEHFFNMKPILAAQFLDMKLPELCHSDTFSSVPFSRAAKNLLWMHGLSGLGMRCGDAVLFWRPLHYSMENEWSSSSFSPPYHKPCDAPLTLGQWQLGSVTSAASTHCQSACFPDCFSLGSPAPLEQRHWHKCCGASLLPCQTSGRNKGGTATS